MYTSNLVASHNNNSNNNNNNNSSSSDNSNSISGSNDNSNSNNDPMDTASLMQCPVIINCDSIYAANSVIGVYNGEKNREMIEHIRRLYKTTKLLANKHVYNTNTNTNTNTNKETPIVFAHVKGHSGHIWNNRADELADLGSQM